MTARGGGLTAAARPTHRGARPGASFLSRPLSCSPCPHVLSPCSRIPLLVPSSVLLSSSTSTMSSAERCGSHRKVAYVRGQGDQPGRGRRDVGAARGRAAGPARGRHPAHPGARRDGLQGQGLQEGLRVLQHGRHGHGVPPADGAHAQRRHLPRQRPEQPVRVQARPRRRRGRVQGRARARRPAARAAATIAAPRRGDP